MPLYHFENKETGEVVTKMMSIADKATYLEENPNMRQVISAPNLIGETGGSVLKKAGDGWKEVQDRIKRGLPPSLKDNINTK